MDQHALYRFSFPLLALALLVAFAFGGGGAKYGLANLAVQLTALGVLAFHRESFVRFWRESPLALRILILASLALPLLQIIPLPEAVWTNLPGRTLVVRAIEQVGAIGWMPFSVDPLRTLLALSALITPVAVLVVGWTLPRHNIMTLGWLIASFGLVTLVLGIVQLASANQFATFYGSRHPGDILLGTFANRNSTGLFLTFAMSLVAVLPAPRPHPALLVARVLVFAALLAAVVLTQSRTSLVLSLLPIFLGAARVLEWAVRGREGTGAIAGDRNVKFAMFAIAMAAVGACTLLVVAPGRIGDTLARFETIDAARRFIWEDASYSVQRYWPAGAGMGTFDETFQVDESLENITMRRAGRAHNDYIELAIEAGAAGLALAAAWLVLLAWLSWKVRRSSQRWAAWAGSAFLVAIALQSITDYPLRNQTILAAAGFALLLLARIAADHMRPQR